MFSFHSYDINLHLLNVQLHVFSQVRQLVLVCVFKLLDVDEFFQQLEVLCALLFLLLPWSSLTNFVFVNEIGNVVDRLEGSWEGGFVFQELSLKM